MLVLSRRIGERIRIGPDVTITVLAVEGGRVKLGCSAPESVRIIREELLESLPLPRATGRVHQRSPKLRVA